MANILLLSSHLAFATCYLGPILCGIDLTIKLGCVCDTVLQYPFLWGRLLNVHFRLEHLCFGNISVRRLSVRQCAWKPAGWQLGDPQERLSHLKFGSSDYDQETSLVERLRNLLCCSA